MQIRFTKHADKKFEVLRKHGVVILRDKVISTVNEPILLDHSRSPLVIAQAPLDKTHVLRVVYKYQAGIAVIITFYPGRKSQYEKR